MTVAILTFFDLAKQHGETLPMIKLHQSAVMRLRNGLQARSFELQKLNESATSAQAAPPIPPARRTGTWYFGKQSKLLLNSSLSTAETISILQNLFSNSPTYYAISTFYFGAAYCEEQERVVLKAKMPDFVYPSIINSLIASNKIDDPAILSIVDEDRPRRAHDLANIIDKLPPSERELIASLFHFKPSNQPIKISDLSAVLADLRSNYLGCIDPPLFSAFIKLLSTKEKIELKHLYHDFGIAKSWQLHRSFGFLALARFATYDTREAREFFEWIAQNLEGNEDDESVSLKGAINAFLNHKSGFTTGKQKNSWLTELTERQLSVRRAMWLENPQAICDAILSAYEFEPTSTNWIDWRALSHVLRQHERIVGVPAVAMYCVMYSSAKIGRYSSSSSYGEGAIISSLRTATERLAKRDIKELAHEISSLPLKASALVSDILTTPAITAVLVGMIGNVSSRKSTLRSKMPVEESYGQFRLRFAFELRRKKVITEERQREIVVEEADRQRIAYIESRRQSGLVRVDWLSLGRELRNSVSEKADVVRSVLREEKSRAGIANELSRLIAEDATDAILYSGSEALKINISDSLRHGQIVNRLVRTWETAIHAALNRKSETGLLQFAHAIEQKPDHPFLWLVLLRKRIAEEVKSFNTRLLNVDRASPFESEICEDLLAEISRFLLNQHNIGDFDSRQSVLKIKRRLKKLLKTANSHVPELIRSVKILTESELGKAPQQPGFDKMRFWDAFSSDIDLATTEIQSWIALEKVKGAVRPFRIEDIIQLNLQYATAQASRKQSIACFVTRQEAGHTIVVTDAPNISGRYYEMFDTILKNMQQNVLERSGLRFRAKTVIEVDWRPDSLSISSTNTVSIPRFQQLLKDIGPLEYKANRANVSDASRDESSGFQKMRWAFKKALGQIPKIELSVFEDEKRIPRFRVRLFGKVSLRDFFSVSSDENSGG